MLPLNSFFLRGKRSVQDHFYPLLFMKFPHEFNMLTWKGPGIIKILKPLGVPIGYNQIM